MRVVRKDVFLRGRHFRAGDRRHMRDHIATYATSVSATAGAQGG
jgi:hypothetical protein